jgi:hypothetical protein
LAGPEHPVPGKVESRRFHLGAIAQLQRLSCTRQLLDVDECQRVAKLATMHHKGGTIGTKEPIPIIC